MSNQAFGGEPPLWKLHIDLDVPLARWQRALQRAIDLVSFGLTAMATVPEGEVRLPGEVLRFAVASNYAMTFLEAKEEFGLWVLQGGFRDVVEGLHDFLEEARVACAAVALGPKFTMPAGWIPPFTRESPEGQRFHWLGLDKKLGTLGDEYSVVLGGELRTAVDGINRARNCLAHRGGVVGDQDKNDPAGLRISWRRLEFLVKDVATGAERLLMLNQLIEAESDVLLHIGAVERLFKLGERVSFTPEDIIGVCFTLLSVGQELSASVVQYTRSKGFPIASKGDTVDPRGPKGTT